MVVIVSPGRGQLPRCSQALEHFGRQELVTQPTVEALGEAVLPGAARFDVQGLDCELLGSTLNRSRDELRAMIAADVLRHAPQRE